MCSLYRKAGNGLKIKRKPPEYKKGDSFEFAYTCIKDKVKSMIEDYSKEDNGPTPVVFEESVTNINERIKDGSLDMVLFSPPYANCFDYTKIYYLELWFGGFVNSTAEQKTIRMKSLRSHCHATWPERYTQFLLPELNNEILPLLRLQKLWTNRIPDMLNGYFADMEEALKQIYSALKFGGHCAIVVSNSAYAGIIIPTDVFLAMTAQRIGFKVTEIEVARLGSRCEEMTATEKIEVIHNFFRPEEELHFHFDAEDMARKGHDFKDCICPDTFEPERDCFRMGDRYGRVVFLRDYANFIKDDIITELCGIGASIMTSIDIIPIPMDEAVREVESKLLGVETNIANWQRRQNQNNNFSAVIPFDMEMQRTESKDFLNDLTNRDQRMMFGVFTIVITADTKEQLDSYTEALFTIGRKRLCQFSTLKYQQLEGLNTVLPYGVRKIDAFRTLTTESTAVFSPFRVQEVFDKGGIYCGKGYNRMKKAITILLLIAMTCSLFACRKTPEEAIVVPKDMERMIELAQKESEEEAEPDTSNALAARIGAVDRYTFSLSKADLKLTVGADALVDITS